MSTPISYCVIYRAARGDESAFKYVAETLEYNLRHGSYTLYGCKHQPPCELPTDAQLEDLDKRVKEAVVALRKHAFGNKSPVKHAPRIPYDKAAMATPDSEDEAKK